MPTPSKIVLKWTTTSREANNRAHSEVLPDGTIIRNADPADAARWGVLYGQDENLISIAATGMRGATPTDFGDYPITPAQVEAMCQEAARFCLLYGIDPQLATVFTHAEKALDEGYGLTSGAVKEVWDLLSLQPLGPHSYDLDRYKEKALLTARLLRARIRRYVAKMVAWGYPTKTGFVPNLTDPLATWHEEDPLTLTDTITPELNP